MSCTAFKKNWITTTCLLPRWFGRTSHPIIIHFPKGCTSPKMERAPQKGLCLFFLLPASIVLYFRIFRSAQRIAVEGLLCAILRLKSFSSSQKCHILIEVRHLRGCQHQRCEVFHTLVLGLSKKQGTLCCNILLY